MTLNSKLTHVARAKVTTVISRDSHVDSHFGILRLELSSSTVGVARRRNHPNCLRFHVLDGEALRSRSVRYFTALIGTRVLLACGTTSPGSDTASSSRVSPTSTSGTPSITSDGAFAILKDWPNASRSGQQTTLATIRRDGSVIATTSFVPPQIPRIPGAPVAAFYPAQTTPTGTYFLDNQGTIRRLSITGSVSLLGNLTLRNHGQPDLAFGISPDGAHAIASIVTFPTYVAGDPGGFGHFLTGSHWYYELETMDVGQAARTVISRDLGVVTGQGQVTPQGLTMVVGWDSVGPLATTGPQLWGQGRPPSPALKTYGQHLVHLSADGTEGSPIGGSDCVPIDELADQSILCTDSAWSRFSVRNSAGRVAWNQSIVDLDPPTILSADGRAAANHSVVFTEGGSTIALPGPANRNVAIYPQGWLDATTVIGDDFGELVLFDTVSPASGYARLGTAGVFMGMV